MKIASPKLFSFSLAFLVVTLLTGYQFHQAIGGVATRDFNFGEPLVYMLIFLQACISLAGIGASLRLTRNP